jgi:hypothetical protein
MCIPCMAIVLLTAYQLRSSGRTSVWNIGRKHAIRWLTELTHVQFQITIVAVFWVRKCRTVSTSAYSGKRSSGVAAWQL